MSRFFVLLFVCFLVQVSSADRAEYYNNHMRTLLNVCYKVIEEPDGAMYAADLKKLVEILEEGLKVDSADEKLHLLDGIENQFSPKFFNWYVHKCEEDAFKDEIQSEIQFYQSLLPNNTQHEAEIRKTVTLLQNLLNETDLEEKRKNFSALGGTFSENFKKFVHEKTLFQVNKNLEYAKTYFESLLAEKDVKFAEEIKNLKEKAEAALAHNISIDEKIETFQNMYNIDNEDLAIYLMDIIPTLQNIKY